MNDFGKRLEAALNRQTTSVLHGADTWVSLLAAVRAANAQVSAPAPVTGESPAQSVDISGAGAGVDMQELIVYLRAIRNDWYARPIGRDEARALLARIESLERDAERWRYLQRNITFYNVGESPGPSLASVSKRIWYHATDCMEWPFSAAIDAARKESKP